MSRKLTIGVALLVAAAGVAVVNARVHIHAHQVAHAEPFPEWFKPISAYYHHNPKITPDYDFAALYSDRAARVSGSAAAAKAGSFPAQLVGRWTRTVTPANVKRTGGTGIPVRTVWTLTVRKSGAAVVGSPSVVSFPGNIVPAGTQRVHINLGTPVANVYTWRVSGRLLTLTRVKDGEPDRAAVFWGVWKRR